MKIKLFYKSHRGGFTLIELMVVISIISLLSSVVLASVKEARLKAQQKVFRQEMQQLINALELYRADYGYYPFMESGGNQTGMSNLDFIMNLNNTKIDNLGFEEKLSPYLKKLPNIPESMVSDTGSAYGYERQNEGKRCKGSSDSPYTIVIYSDNLLYDLFKDWPMLETYLYNASYVLTWAVRSPYYRCFSL